MGTSAWSQNDDDSRTLSFARPDRIPAAELLKLGLATDGNQVVFNVGPRLGQMSNLRYFYPSFEEGSRMCVADDLPEALAEAEKALVDYLGRYEYDVEFK